jgi:hypothetical protein
LGPILALFSNPNSAETVQKTENIFYKCVLEFHIRSVRLHFVDAVELKSIWQERIFVKVIAGGIAKIKRVY